jgi:hypothetical protein
MDDEFIMVCSWKMLGGGPVPGSGPIREVVGAPSGNVYALRDEADGGPAALWVTDGRHPWVRVG